jgi:hypothetical protein
MGLVLLAPGCALSLGHPSISQLQRNPARYQDRTVNVDGVVTTSWGVPFVPFKLYRIADGTGEVTVLSQAPWTPTRGTRVRVRGRVDDFAVIGGRSLGLHLREEHLRVRR